MGREVVERGLKHRNMRQSSRSRYLPVFYAGREGGERSHRDREPDESVRRCGLILAI